MSVTDRYLLCRPAGGLADSLATIERGRQYCLRSGRILVVDGVRSNFVRQFSDVFTMIEGDRVVLGPSRRLLAHLDALSCRPVEVQGRLRRYEVRSFTPEGMNPLESRFPVDALTGALLQVSLDDDYPEDVVLFESHSPVDGAENFLAMCRLTARVARAVNRRLEPVQRLVADGGYVGLHVRNSDLRSDWREYMALHAESLAGRNVVVCSDDREVLDAAPAALPRSTVVVPTRVPSTGGRPYQGQFVARRHHRQLAVDVLVDLLALAGADDVLSPPVVNRTISSSSFTHLARAVSRVPGLREQLLSG